MIEHHIRDRHLTRRFGNYFDLWSGFGHRDFGSLTRWRLNNDPQRILLNHHVGLHIVELHTQLSDCDGHFHLL